MGLSIRFALYALLNALFFDFSTEKAPKKQKTPQETFLRRVKHTRGTTQITEKPPLRTPTSPIP